MVGVKRTKMTSKTGNVFVDSSVWIELFSNVQAASVVSSALAGKTLATTSLVLAEIASYAARTGTLPEVLRDIRVLADIVSIDEALGIRAGELHGKLRRHRAKISLADCALLAAAEYHKGVVITFDTDFRGLPGVKLLKKGKQ